MPTHKSVLTNLKWEEATSTIRCQHNASHTIPAGTQMLVLKENRKFHQKVTQYCPACAEAMLSKAKEKLQELTQVVALGSKPPPVNLSITDLNNASVYDTEDKVTR